MEEDCLFCKIVKGEIPSTKIYEDDTVYAFRDIEPLAPTHILVIPKKHIARVTDLTEKDEIIVGKIFAAINKIAKQENINESGFRVITNCGKDANQVVMHVHYHLLGGKELGPKILV